MSTPTALAYPLALRHLGRGRVDLLTADLRLMLCTSGYVPADTDEYLPVPAAWETAGTGYPAGGLALPNRSFDYDTALRRAVLTCDPVVFPAAGFVARWGVVYAAGGDFAARPLLARIDFGADVDPGGQDFTVTFADGVIRLGPVSGA